MVAWRAKLNALLGMYVTHEGLLVGAPVSNRHRGQAI